MPSSIAFFLGGKALTLVIVWSALSEVKQSILCYAVQMSQSHSG